MLMTNVLNVEKKLRHLVLIIEYLKIDIFAINVVKYFRNYILHSYV